MKSSGFLLILSLICFLILPKNNFSQGVNVHKMIGESLNKVTSVYGNPVHKDMANPEMQCVFYKTANEQFVFVANASGVYQAEGSVGFQSKKSAMAAIDDFINSCKTADCKIDTLNPSEYHFEKPGVRADVSLFENTYSKKYEIQVKANKKE